MFSLSAHTDCCVIDFAHVFLSRAACALFKYTKKTFSLRFDEETESACDRYFTWVFVCTLMIGAIF